MWSGVAARPTRMLMLLGDALYRLIREVPEFTLGIVGGLSFKGKYDSALAQILGTRSVTERLAHPMLQLADIYLQTTARMIASGGNSACAIAMRSSPWK